MLGSLTVHARDITVVTVSGSGYQRGLEHGKQLQKSIHRVAADWKKSIRDRSRKDPDFLIAEFMRRTDFVTAARQWTPGLLDEVRGVADGSGAAFNDIFVLQLWDEFWPNAKPICRDRCSALGIRSSSASYVAQNMDMIGWLDG